MNVQTLAPAHKHRAEPRSATMGSARTITVCQVLHSLSVGGAEILAARIARRLNGPFRFLFVCLDDVGALSHDLRREGFDVYELGRKPGFDWNCALRLARILRVEHVDLVHAHQYAPFLYAMMARLRGPRRPILFTEHGRHQPDYPRRKRMVVNRVMLSRRDRIVGVGAAVRQALIDNEGLPEHRVAVLYNGVDVAAIAAAGDRGAARDALQAAPDDFVVVQVARLDYLKDHGTALRAWSRVLRQTPHARLILIGDGPERPTIESRIAELGLGESVRLLGSRRDVAWLLSGADAFLLTSISEGIPLTVIEAMSAGLPVVATDVGGVAEVVEDGLTGFLAPARDDAGLAERMIQLAADPERRRQLGQAGLARARLHFDESRMCGEYQSLYREMCRA